MNLFTSNSKLLNSSIIYSLIATFACLSIYHILIITKLLKPSDGIQQWQINFIKIQRYAYQDYSQVKMVTVGSSLTVNLPIDDIGSSVINLGMAGGCTQTGLEAVWRNSSRPAILMIEINETISRKLDARMIDFIYNPLLYTVRLYMPMLREEYQPVSVFLTRVVPLIHQLKSTKRLVNKQKDNNPVVNVDQKLTDTLIRQITEDYKNPLSENEKRLLRQEARAIKIKISKIRKDGVRVVLFDVPRDSQVQATVRGKQLHALMKELFPVNDFEWLPEPPPRQWTTSDGLHLVSSDARDYVAFLKKQLFIKNTTLSKPVRLHLVGELD